MAEEEISSTGQYHALGAADPVSSYQPSSSVERPAVSPTGSPASAGASASAPSSAAARPTKQPTAQEIATAVAAANANLANSNRELDYRVDAATGISIALIRNSQTGVVVQQIPGADIIALARMLADWSPGKHMLLDLIA
jgi:flagellar protein FlaG